MTLHLNSYFNGLYLWECIGNYKGSPTLSHNCTDIIAFIIYALWCKQVKG